MVLDDFYNINKLIIVFTIYGKLWKIYQSSVVENKTRQYAYTSVYLKWLFDIAQVFLAYKCIFMHIRENDYIQEAKIITLQLYLHLACSKTLSWLCHLRMLCLSMTIIWFPPTDARYFDCCTCIRLMAENPETKTIFCAIN